jgi:hypothetical protein
MFALLIHVANGSLIRVCWINETASNLIHHIFNLGNKESQPATNQGAWDNTGIPNIAKNSETTPAEYADAMSRRRYQDPPSRN